MPEKDEEKENKFAEEDEGEALKKWNPMNEAFKNINFNSYAAGPGAQLSTELQHSAIQTKNSAKKNPYLCIKKAPKTFDIKGIYNLFSNYAKVANVKHLQNCDYYFVEFKFLPEMQKAYDSLQNNPFGMEIYFGLEKDKPQIHEPSSLPAGERKEKETYDCFGRKKPDLSARTFKGPFFRPPYSMHTLLRKYARKSCIDDNIYETTNFKVVDPQKHFAFGVDMWDRDEFREEEIDESIDGGLVVLYGAGYYRNSTTNEAKIAKDLLETRGTLDENNTLKVSSKANILGTLFHGPCEFCSRTTFKQCDQCLYFFCSIECLKNDSKNHNYTCKRSRGKRPKTQVKIFNDGTLTFRKGLKTGCEVTIVSILQPNLFFVRVNSEYDDSENLKNLDKIYNLCKSISNPIEYIPNVGDVVFCKFYTRGFNRAIVLDNNDLSSIALIFIDFGNIHYVPLENVYPIPNDHFSVPRTVFPVKLRGVEKFYANKKCQEYLKSLIERDNFKMSFNRDQTGRNLKEVLITDLINNENVNETIKEMRNFPEPDIHRDIFYTIPKSQVRDKITMDYVIMDVSYIEQTYMISVIPKKDIPSLQEVEDEIQLYANKNHRCYTPRENELCIVKQIDGRWYRGQCLEVVGDGVPSIELIDYGHIDTIPIEDIRMYPKQLLHPVCTVTCSIDGVPDVINPEVGKLLKAKLEFGMRIEGFIEIKTEEDKTTYILNIPRLIKVLKNKNLYFGK